MTDHIQNNEDLHVGLKVVSFCMPIVGLVLYLVNKSKAPLKAKSAGKFALIGLVVGIVLNILAYVFAGDMGSM